MNSILMVLLGSMALSTHVSYVINWNNPQSLKQGNSIDCQYAETAAVIITAPGIINHDFKVSGPGGSCKIVTQKTNRDDAGNVSTTVTFQGPDCFSDNDDNFFVDEIGTGKEAAITADSGC